MVRHTICYYSHINPGVGFMTGLVKPINQCHYMPDMLHT